MSVRVIKDDVVERAVDAVGEVVEHFLNQHALGDLLLARQIRRVVAVARRRRSRAQHAHRAAAPARTSLKRHPTARGPIKPSQDRAGFQAAHPGRPPIDPQMPADK